MKSRAVSAEAHQYGTRSSEEIRATLLELTRDFTIAASRVQGVRRIALIGSLLTTKTHPKDTDLLVTIADDIALGTLARLSRRLKGTAQTRLDSGADVFLANTAGEYVGRICHYRECHPRALCHARHCGAVPHLADDLDVVTLDPALIAMPPFELWPAIAVRVPLPADVTQLLVNPLQAVNRSQPC